MDRETRNAPLNNEEEATNSGDDADDGEAEQKEEIEFPRWGDPPEINDGLRRASSAVWTRFFDFYNWIEENEKRCLFRLPKRREKPEV